MTHPQRLFSLSLLTIALSVGAGGCSQGGGSGSGAATGLDRVGAAPDNGATSVDRRTTISARFGEDLDGSALAPDWMTATVGGRPILGGLVIDQADPRRLVLTPLAALPAGSTVRVSLSTSIRSLSGRTLAQPMAWSFATDAGGGGSVTTVGVTSLPCLQTGPAGSLGNMSVVPLPDTRELAVVWTSAAGFVETATFGAGGTFGPVRSVATLLVGLTDGAVADGQGGLLVNLGFETLHFTPSATASVPLPASLTAPDAALHSGQALVIGAGSRGPFDATTAYFDVATGRWVEQVNSTGQPVEFGGRLLPGANGGFQSLVVVHTGSAYEVVAREISRTGAVLVSTSLVQGPTGVGILAADSTADGRSVVALFENTSSGLAITLREYTPMNGWGEADPVTTSTAGFANAIIYSRVAASADGRAVFVSPNARGNATRILHRDGPDAGWSETELEGAIQVEVGCSDAEGVLVAGVAAGNQVIVVGRSPEGAWSDRTNLRSVGGFDGLVGRLLVDPSGQGSFLVVVDGLDAASNGAICPMLVTLR